jgi:hypothetical protein
MALNLKALLPLDHPCPTPIVRERSPVSASPPGPGEKESGTALKEEEERRLYKKKGAKDGINLKLLDIL